MPNEYSATVTPFRATCCKLPISTFSATIASLILYIIAIILIFATNCAGNSRVSYLLAFLIMAILATCSMAAINMMYTRYHFNCLSLSVSLLYSGSAALVALGLFVTAINGICESKGPKRLEPTRESNFTTAFPSDRADLFQTDGQSKSLFTSGHVGSYFIWAFAAIGDAFQIVAHYYYG